MTEESEHRCQSLRIQQLPVEIVNYYDDLQKDYIKFMRLLISWSGEGHLIQHDNKTEIITPEASKTLCESASNNLSAFMSIVAKGGTNAQNCCGILYSKYKNGTKNPIKTFLNKIIDFKEKGVYEDKVSKIIKQYPIITKNDWDKYLNRLLSGVSSKVLWEEEVKHKIGRDSLNPGVKLVNLLKKEGISPLPIRHDNSPYCKALWSMLVSSFSGWTKSSELHKKTRESLRKKVENAKHPDVLKALWDLSVVFEKANYGLSYKVLSKSINLVKENKIDSYFELACEELKKDKYKSILDCEYKSLWTTYKLWKIANKLKRMKPYVSMPKFSSDYMVPFGLTGTGMPFELSLNEKLQLVVNVKNSSFVCQRSHYFSNMSLTCRGNCYLLKFRHKLKSKTQESYGEWIDSELREIKIRKNNKGNFNLYLPYKIEIPDRVTYIERFFNSADKSKCLKWFEQLPDKITICGFDLNLSTPLTFTGGFVEKNVFGKSLKDINYGSGNITVMPKIIEKDTALSGQIVNLKNKMCLLKNAIGECKKAIKNGGEIQEVTSNWLNEIVAIPMKSNRSYIRRPGQRPLLPQGKVRYQIQLAMKLFGLKYKKLANKCRANGHNNLSESIRLLQLIDVKYDLQKSYTNIHVVGSSIQQIYVLNKNDKRSNFRKFVSRQYASCIVNSAKGFDIVFIEDLNIGFDSDSNANGIARLFASGQLKNAIRDACHKAGIGCVFVDPSLTSKTDSITGILGYRFKYNKNNPWWKTKEYLYVIRNGEIGWINSDITASLNVLLKGLAHSVFSGRKLQVIDGKIKGSQTEEGQIEGEDDEKFSSMRIKRLVLERKNVPIPENGIVYATPTGYITEEEKIKNAQEMEKKITDLCLSRRKIPNFSLSPDLTNAYCAFSVRVVLDYPEVVSP